MTYEERLQEYAQMHADKRNSRYGDEMGGTDMLPESFKEEAEVTIAAVAEGIRTAYIENSYGDPARLAEQYLIENGYVPKPK